MIDLADVIGDFKGSFYLQVVDRETKESLPFCVVDNKIQITSSGIHNAIDIRIKSMSEESEIWILDELGLTKV